MKAFNYGKLTTLLVLAITLAFLSSCEKDKNSGDSSASIVGTWTLQSSSVDVTVDGQSLVSFVAAALGISEAEAAIFIEAFSEEVITAGTITFNADGTYSANFDNEPDSGTYTLSSDNKTLTMDGGTSDEMVMNITSLSSSSLAVENTETTMEDYDEDGTDDTIVTKISMTFSR